MALFNPSKSLTPAEVAADYLQLGSVGFVYDAHNGGFGDTNKGLTWEGQLRPLPKEVLTSTLRFINDNGQKTIADFIFSPNLEEGVKNREEDKQRLTDLGGQLWLTGKVLVKDLYNHDRPSVKEGTTFEKMVDFLLDPNNITLTQIKLVDLAESFGVTPQKILNTTRNDFFAEPTCEYDVTFSLTKVIAGGRVVKPAVKSYRTIGRFIDSLGIQQVFDYPVEEKDNPQCKLVRSNALRVTEQAFQSRATIALSAYTMAKNMGAQLLAKKEQTGTNETEGLALKLAQADRDTLTKGERVTWTSATGDEKPLKRSGKVLSHYVNRRDPTSYVTVKETRTGKQFHIQANTLEDVREGYNDL